VEGWGHGSGVGQTPSMLQILGSIPPQSPTSRKKGMLNKQFIGLQMFQYLAYIIWFDITTNTFKSLL
jgi:hypothetical protein